MPRPERLDKIAEEESTYPIKCTFKDEGGNLVAPATVNWDLTTVGGNVVNNRLDVFEGSPASVMYILLNGDDLQLFDGEESFGERILTVRASYNSSLGAGLPLNKFVRFRVRNLRLIAYPLSVNIYDRVFVRDFEVVSL